MIKSNITKANKAQHICDDYNSRERTTATVTRESIAVWWKPQTWFRRRYVVVVVYEPLIPVQHIKVTFTMGATK